MRVSAPAISAIMDILYINDTLPSNEPFFYISSFTKSRRTYFVQQVKKRLESLSIKEIFEVIALMFVGRGDFGNFDEAYEYASSFIRDSDVKRAAISFISDVRALRDVLQTAFVSVVQDGIPG